MLTRIRLNRSLARHTRVASWWALANIHQCLHDDNPTGGRAYCSLVRDFAQDEGVTPLMLQGIKLRAWDRRLNCSTYSNRKGSE